MTSSITPSVRPARGTNRPVTVAALILALGMAAMEMTVVSTAMPTVVADLGGTRHYAWVFAAYMLASTVMVPIHGKLADLYGRKPVMLASMAFFLAGSVASGQARSMSALIAFRALQGVGAGGIQPIAFTILGDIYDVEARARMQGLFSAVWAIAGVTGPLLGGFLVAALSWRWVFYVNVLPGFASALLLSAFLVESFERKPRSLDVGGAALLAAAVIALLLSVEGVAPEVLVPSSVAAALALVVVERRAREPMLPPALLKTPVIARASVLSTATGAATIGLLTFVPLYAQGVLGTTPTEAGAAIAPMAMTWPVASAVSGRLIPRFGLQRMVRAGMTIVGLSTFGLALAMTRGATSGELRLVAACFGIGMGLGNTALLLAVQSSVGFEQRGVATSSSMFFRTIGGTVGVGLMGVVLARALAGSALARGGDADFVARILGPARRSLAPEILGGIAGDLRRGIVHVIWIEVALGAIALTTAWLFPDAKSSARPTP